MLGVWVGKLSALALRILRRRATSLPGKLALRVSPRLLRKLGSQLQRCIVVTGTNGKTTTSALLGSILETEAPIIRNAEGANLPQGLASALLRQTNWLGRLRYKTALLEIDEATLPLVAQYFPIRVVVVTNVFRDQLDRYGELDTTLQKLLDGLAQTQAMALLNADDPLARYIGVKSGRQVAYFGMAREHLHPQHRDQIRDGSFCLECGHALEYEGFYYGQLGIYKCPHCDFFRPHPDFIGEISGGQLSVRQADLPKVSYELPVRGIFNVYNALCAIAAARVCGVDAGHIAQGLSHFEPPLGRMQAFRTTPPVILNLIKNPTGCDSVIQAICAEPGEKVLCVAINDLAADGKDVSWLWDADFELIAEDGQFVHCVTTGLRAEDMALRLKYGGYPEQGVTFVADLEAGLNRALEIGENRGNLPVYVVSTYTALYPLAGLLERRVHANDTSATYRASVS